MAYRIYKSKNTNHRKPTTPSIHQRKPQDYDAVALQRAIENPTSDTLTPEIIRKLQTTHGNTFVRSLIQQSRQNTSETASSQSPIMIQRWQTAAPSATPSPNFSAIKSDDISMIAKIKGLKKAKKSV